MTYPLTPEHIKWLLRETWLKKPIQDALKKAKWVIRNQQVQPFRRMWAAHVE